MNSLQDTPARVEALSGLSRFRAGFHACFTRRGDALFELADAMLCAQGPVRSPVELSLEPEFRRRHGSVYDALAKGRISSSCLRHLLAGLSAPARAGEPLMFAIDITPHARPDARYADERTMVQVRGKGGDRWLPGWPYSLLVGIQWGSSSWVDPIEARRLRPGEEHTDVTIGQITGLLKDLTATGTWQPGDPPPLVLLDAGNYATDLTHALAGHDVHCWSGCVPPGSSTSTPHPGGRARWARRRATARSSPAPAPPDGTPPTSSAPRSPGSTAP